MSIEIFYIFLVLIPNVTAKHHHGPFHGASDINPDATGDTKQKDPKYDHAVKCDEKPDTKHHDVKCDVKPDTKTEASKCEKKQEESKAEKKKEESKCEKKHEDSKVEKKKEESKCAIKHEEPKKAEKKKEEPKCEKKEEKPKCKKKEEKPKCEKKEEKPKCEKKEEKPKCEKKEEMPKCDKKHDEPKHDDKNLDKKLEEKSTKQEVKKKLDEGKCAEEAAKKKLDEGKCGEEAAKKEDEENKANLGTKEDESKCEKKYDDTKSDKKSETKHDERWTETKHEEPKTDKKAGTKHDKPQTYIKHEKSEGKTESKHETSHDLVTIGKKTYKKQLLVNIFGATELVYEHFSEGLFFAYTGTDASISARAYYDMTKKILVPIPCVFKSRATATDAKTGDVYFGSNDGLYQYRPKCNNVTNIGFRRFSIKKLIMKHDKMVMVAGCKRKIYTLEPEIDYSHRVYISRRIGRWEDVKDADIDSRKRVHIVVTDIGLFCLDTKGNAIINSDLTDVDCFVQKGNHMFGVVGNQMWLLNCCRGTARKYAKLDFEPQSMIFVENEAFVSTNNKVYHLYGC